MVELWWW